MRDNMKHLDLASIKICGKSPSLHVEAEDLVCNYNGVRYEFLIIEIRKNIAYVDYTDDGAAENLANFAKDAPELNFIRDNDQIIGIEFNPYVRRRKIGFHYYELEGGEVARFFEAPTDDKNIVRYNIEYNTGGVDCDWAVFEQGDYLLPPELVPYVLEMQQKLLKHYEEFLP